MDELQRKQIGEQVRSVREGRGLTQAALAEAAGVSPNTVLAIEKGRDTQTTKLGAVMTALQIQPLAEAISHEDTSQDVHMALEMMRMWLADMPQDERPRAMYDVMRYIMTQR